MAARFSGDAKDEIARVRFERSCCPAAFLRGMARVARRHGAHTILMTERGAAARAAISAARAAGIPLSADRKQTKRFAGHALFDVKGDAPLLGSQPPARGCCRRAWLRGAFLAGGSVTDPGRAYHLEFFCRDDAAARLVCDTLALLGIDAGLSRRRGRPLVYVKGAQAVADVLAQLGASQAVFALDNVRAVRQTKNDIRRRVNSESANAARAAASSVRQRDAAMRAIRAVGLGRLSAELAQAAQLRIAHPDLTLSELAARARPRITKATMGYRMRALERVAAMSRGPRSATPAVRFRRRRPEA